MATFRVIMRARKVGAIGIFYPVEFNVSAVNARDAICKVIDRESGQWEFQGNIKSERMYRNEVPDCEHLNGCGNPMNNQC